MLRFHTRITGKELFLTVVFYVLLLQNALERAVPAFSYTDELFAAMGIIGILYPVMKSGYFKMRRSTARMACAFSLFLAAGLLGNFLFQYQPLGVALTDLYTNMKFFLAVLSGYVLFRNYSSRREQSVIAAQARTAAAVFFAVFLLDRLFLIFPSSEVRYGMRVSQLMYSHATYLAGAMVFLLAVLTSDYQKQNLKYIIMCLLMLIFTFRGKAMAGAAIYCVIFYFCLIRKRKLKAWHVAAVALVALAVAGEQFYYYYIALNGQSARSVLTQTSFEILKDYFPIGTGFGTYASHSAAEHYSPVYVKYGFLRVYELGGGQTGFFDDTFWPIIIGQTGLLGSLGYLAALGLLFHRVLKIRKVSISAYAAGIFIVLYLLISSTSEPAFNNSVSIPLAMMLGYILTLEKEKRYEKTERHRDRNLSMQCPVQHVQPL